MANYWLTCDVVKKRVAHGDLVGLWLCQTLQFTPNSTGSARPASNKAGLGLNKRRRDGSEKKKSKPD